MPGWGACAGWGGWLRWCNLAYVNWVDDSPPPHPVSSTTPWLDSGLFKWRKGAEQQSASIPLCFLTPAGQLLQVSATLLSSRPWTVSQSKPFHPWVVFVREFLSQQQRNKQINKTTFLEYSSTLLAGHFLADVLCSDCDSMNKNIILEAMVMAKLCAFCCPTIMF